MDKEQKLKMGAGSCASASPYDIHWAGSGHNDPNAPQAQMKSMHTCRLRLAGCLGAAHEVEGVAVAIAGGVVAIGRCLGSRVRDGGFAQVQQIHRLCGLGALLGAGNLLALAGSVLVWGCKSRHAQLSALLVTKLAQQR